MPAGHGLALPLVVASQPTRAAQPRERPFDDPASRQQQESPLGFRMLDDRELDPCSGRGLPRSLALVALIDVCERHRAAGDLLHVLRQSPRLSPLLLVCRRDAKRQQIPKRVDRDVDFRTFFFFAPSKPARPDAPLFGVD